MKLREYIIGALLALVVVLCMGHGGGVNSLFRFREWRDNAAVGRVFTCTNATDGSGCYSNVNANVATNFVRPLFQTSGTPSSSGGAFVTLYSNLITANTVGADGSAIYHRFEFDSTGAAAAGRRINLYFGNTNSWTLIYDSGVPTNASPPAGTLITTITRTGGATQKSFCRFYPSHPELGYTNLWQHDNGLGFDWSTDAQIHIRATATSTDSLTGKDWMADLRPATQ